ncbi:hypothetical protein [Sediminibacter sp. Hel_I_10]|uniref:hypothetical protein n=1 Tax=Sediminibacter sp. Hel_I_10 TaxID=1392490 RepID=UPI00047E705F|nr:hypothetical protein [Sediminibacter sp. Hel_I_10]
MKKKKSIITVALVLCLFHVGYNSYSQVGIGTATPEESSALDISSTSKGLLAPRMTTIQRVAIDTPANGLLVYDITENAFYFYQSSAWIRMESEVRENFKLIKSVSDLSEELTAGGGSKYLLSTNKVYEINGVINLAHPIDLNEAYLTGVDSSDDILVKSGGTLFEGSKGGLIKNLTISASGATVFNLSGSGNLVIKDTYIANSNAVGSISDFDLVYFSVVQYVNNTDGISFSDIGNLLLSNTAWQSSNSGTYETFSGLFNLIQKQGGFMEVDGSAVGIDVSANPTPAKAVLTGANFAGSSIQYINKYTSGTFPNYNFTNVWTVNCPGIPVESDEASTGNIYYNGSITAGFVQSITSNSPVNLSGSSNTNTTTAVNLLRTSSPQNNRLTYNGKKTKTFQVNASLSVRGNSGTGDFYAFFIRKNGNTTLVETNSLLRVNNTTDIINNAITGTVELSPNDYIEVWAQRLTGSGTTSIAVFSLNLNIK